ncbi:TIGR02679 domain-containing protein [Streptomyces sp. NPDC032198]|uniref:TIGR02679 domain-containing protein n=1 Tax=Streptomyces sp. NPDC032198 TaxID=3155127 RepID=UPI0034024C5E
MLAKSRPQTSSLLLENSVTNNDIDASLLAWAKLPGPSKVIEEVRRRIGQRGIVRGEIKVELTESERREVGKLLGLSWVTSGKGVSVQPLEKALAGRSATLRSLAESQGKLDDLRALKAQKQAERETEFSESLRSLTAAGVPNSVAHWFLKLRARPRAGSGSLKHQVDAVGAVWAKLPTADQGAVSLPVFAAAVLDDPHALDKDTELGRAMAVLITGCAAFETDGAVDLADRVTPGTITAGENWRTAWAARGIACDEVSSTVLCLNLTLTGTASAVSITAAAATVGEPVWLTQRSLRGPWSMAPGADAVYVCENPAVVEAAAEQYGTSCAPLVCTYGWPSSAALELITGLERSGAQLHLRADDDNAGQRIVALLREYAPGSRLWRYELRVTAANDTAREYEEQVLSKLLHDLRGQ